MNHEYSYFPTLCSSRRIQGIFEREKLKTVILEEKY